MRRAHCGWLIGPLAAGLMLACATYRLDAPTPAKRAPDLPPLVSHLTVPVTISADSLTNEFNRRFSEREGEDGVFFRREIRLPMRGATAQFGLKRGGPATVSVENQQLTYRVPLAVEQGQFVIEQCGRILGCRKTQGQFGGAALITGVTQITITEEWLLTSKTHLELAWQEGPWVELQGADTTRVELREILDLLARERIAEALRRAATRIDARISRVDFRKRIDTAWQRIQQPIQILKDPPLWLVVSPLSAGIGAPQIDGEQVRFDATITATMRVQTGQNIPATVLVPLPDNRGWLEAGGTHIQVPLMLEYAYLNQLLKERLAGKTLTFKSGVLVTIGDMQVSAHGNLMKIAVQFQAENIPPFLTPASGVLLLVGQPVYDQIAGRVTVEDFDFELHTSDSLHQAADWLLHDYFVQRVQERLVFDVGSRLASFQDKLKAQLSKFPLGKGVTVTLPALDFVPTAELVVHDTDLLVTLSINGEAKVYVEFSQLETK